ncbi:MAG: DNA polymerase Y family protein [Phycisphaerales bacterium]|nr:DNA polymerase Y family protein [Phycisphaerales bacterium]
MRRAMCVWLPSLRIDLVRRRDSVGRGPGRERPILVVSREGGGRESVVDACALAQRAGVRPGMPAGEARAALGSSGVRTIPDDPEALAGVLLRLAVFMQRFSPVVAIDSRDGLLLDITGCARLFGGEDRILARAGRALRRLGLASRIAIAPTFACAQGVARYARSAGIVAEGGQRDALAPLPIAALGVDEQIAAGLGEVGVDRIGQLMALPRSSLPARFGEELLWRLDCAMGDAIETIEPVRSEPSPEAEMIFDGPTTRTDAIAAAVRTLLDRLAGAMRARGLGARRLRLTLLRVGVSPFQIEASFGRPSRDPVHLWSILGPSLERAHLGHGVEGVRIVAERFGRLGHEQAGESHAIGEDPKAVAELVDTLCARLGRHGVLRILPAESHLPERAARLAPAADAPPRGPVAAMADALRPTLLLDRPEPAAVVSLTPDGPVMHVSWRGGSARVTACSGPERISPVWWDAKARAETRDYFRVRDGSGRWLWLCRAVESGRWFVHGVWA